MCCSVGEILWVRVLFALCAVPVFDSACQSFPFLSPIACQGKPHFLPVSHQVYQSILVWTYEMLFSTNTSDGYLNINLNGWPTSAHTHTHTSKHAIHIHIEKQRTNMSKIVPPCMVVELPCRCVIACNLTCEVFSKILLHSRRMWLFWRVRCVSLNEAQAHKQVAPP